ncbi:hypothetical protein SmJEL517_g00796 [Synchytrium microbalum]|uniref:Uncharacterized protein n=1 Tax=Synchytrium microbalum TaxID=1806994 RepID=A0A507C7Z9_9FUNG|nr:uncharacterized protein SmJEL517_g00796 [Synchytrium microbalum]TPX37177.1 hypothetical protein SmJEL517_g00796 [Synchytrium microbalum]
MGQRTNPLGLRLRTLLNWPSSVRHPFLSAYIRHIFQSYLVAEPGIRSSTSGIWVNVTLLDPTGNLPAHPKANRMLQFKNVDLSTVLGRFERKIWGVRQFHPYYSKIVPEANVHHLSPQLPVEASSTIPPTLQALQIYRDTPIHLRMNVITNPLLNAEILAQYVAKSCQRGKQLARVHRELLEKLG